MLGLKRYSTDIFCLISVVEPHHFDAAPDPAMGRENSEAPPPFFTYTV
jgi:hypothetical protein